MSFAVEFTTGARQDLLKIYRYIKADGMPETAKRLYEMLSLACNSLSQNPERGHVPSELEGLSETLCRQIVIKNIRIKKTRLKKQRSQGCTFHNLRFLSIRLIFNLNFLSFLSFSEKH